MRRFCTLSLLTLTLICTLFVHIRPISASLEPMLFKVMGRVVDSEGAGLEGAEVEVYADEFGPGRSRASETLAEAKTGKNGEFSIEYYLPNGAFSDALIYLRAAKDGYAPKEKVGIDMLVNLMSDRISWLCIDYPIVLGPGLKVQGRVRSAGGTGIAGAVVVFASDMTGGPVFEARCDGKGEYEVRADSEEICNVERIYIDHDEYRLSYEKEEEALNAFWELTESAEDAPDSPLVLDIIAGKRSTSPVKISVVDESTGDPAIDCHVEVFSLGLGAESFESENPEGSVRYEQPYNLGMGGLMHYFAGPDGLLALRLEDSTVFGMTVRHPFYRPAWCMFLPGVKDEYAFKLTRKKTARINVQDPFYFDALKAGAFYIEPEYKEEEDSESVDHLELFIPGRLLVDRDKRGVFEVPYEHVSELVLWPKDMPPFIIKDLKAGGEYIVAAKKWRTVRMALVDKDGAPVEGARIALGCGSPDSSFNYSLYPDEYGVVEAVLLDEPDISMRIFTVNIEDPPFRYIRQRGDCDLGKIVVR